MTELMRVARERGLAVMEGEVLAENARMLQLVKGLGFTAATGEDPSVRIVTREL